MTEENTKPLTERLTETIHELFDGGPEGERDGGSIVEEGTRVGSGFGTFGTGTLPAQISDTNDRSEA
jgi:hypothetical protein